LIYEEKESERIKEYLRGPEPLEERITIQLVKKK